jgi:hypothetical protein
LDQKEYFWRGPVRTPIMAVRIIRWTGWVFVILGAASVISTLNSLDGGPESRIGGLVLALLLAAPGGVLLMRKSRTPAIMLLALNAVIVLTMTAVGFKFLRHPSGDTLPYIFPLLIWLTPLWLAWRAVRATSAFRAMRSNQTAAENTGEVFD